MNTRVIKRIFCASLVGAFVQTAAAQLDLSWYTIDGGGVTFSSGSGLALGATAGQNDAGVMTGGGLTMIGGFWTSPTPPAPCPGDFDGNGQIDLSDLAQLLSDYGCTGGGCIGDLDGDGDTNLSDLAALLSVYGENCS